MALTEPYPLAFLNDMLAPIADCQLSLVRYEEQSGSRSGQFWTAQLAPPLWQAAITLGPRRWEEGREINAKVTALGTMKSFLFADPCYAPASGATAGGSVVIGTIATNRTMLSLIGLPAGYRITAGDRFSTTHSGGRYYFGEFVESITANGSGVTGQVAIEPPLPQGVVSGPNVRLDRPLIRLRVPQGSFTSFTFTPGGLATGGSIIGMQKP
ncbi:hypothetical protein RGQ15_13605 [Paracoccus sp. MBLB3053]|uniref:Uncharacterized protein n=1 Tax=Paracoccus aurantius TaxID=3073814 RepID=A0ABU2HVQ3_9RHOB|nr:hypothetical protein [Paracoccus sp. MBLB3053]MDS9468600.1 hypothetical protein [Paracoccus sp. MBLB3053]